MDREELQRLATKHKLGKVYFQFNVAKNSGREFEVGYVSLSNGRRGLFCKRASNSNPDQFYLCNDYAKLDETRLDYEFDDFVQKAGWDYATQAGVLYEFITSNGLTDDLNRFLTKNYRYEIECDELQETND